MLQLNREKKIVLIFSTQRSGSTMVTSDFTQAQILGNPGEYFTKNILPGSKFDNCYLSPEEIQTELHNILRQASTPNGIASIKVMSDYITEIAKALEKAGITNDCGKSTNHFSESSQEYLQNIFVDFFNTIDIDNNFVAFRVYREDKIKQAVSRFVAGRTGLYHIWKNDEGQNVNSYDRPADRATPGVLDVDRHYDYERLHFLVDLIYQQEKNLDDFFNRFDISPINLIYEDIVGDTSYLEDVVKHIDKIEASDKIGDITRKTVKTSSKINDEIIRRFNSDGGYKGKVNYAISR